MEENNQLQPLKLPPENITDAVVKALFNKEAMRKDYQKILQGLSNLHFSKDNLQQSYPELKAADKFLKDMDDIRKLYGKPYGDVLEVLMRVFREVIQPISELTVSKKAELKAANELAVAELKKVQAENARVENIKKAIGNFINLITREISFAQNNEHIVLIQKKIGAEKSRTTFYAEFLRELKDKCDSLTQTINDRKEMIRKATELQKQFDETQANDPVKAAQTKGEMEYVAAALTDNSLRLQEKAFEQASTIEVVSAEPMIEVAKVKTRRWLWRVDDINLLYKKMPHLVKLVADKDAIDTLLATKRNDGSLKGKEEEKFFGITFYQEKYY